MEISTEQCACFFPLSKSVLCFEGLRPDVGDPFGLAGFSGSLQDMQISTQSSAALLPFPAFSENQTFSACLLQFNNTLPVKLSTPTRAKDRMASSTAAASQQGSTISAYSLMGKIHRQPLSLKNLFMWGEEEKKKKENPTLIGSPL